MVFNLPRWLSKGRSFGVGMIVVRERKYKNWFAIAWLLLTIFTSVGQPSLAQTDAELPKPLLQLQQQLLEDAYPQFLNDLHDKYPSLIYTTPPPFKPSLGRNDWLDYYIDWTVEQNSMDGKSINAFKTAAKNMFTSYTRNVGYARLPYIESGPEVPGKGSANTRSIQKIKLAPSYPEDHTLDVKKYVDGRFPEALQNFLRNRLINLYLHDCSCQDAFSYHHLQGYAQAYHFMGMRDRSDSPFMFSYNSKINKYRFVICDMHGQDAITRIIGILGPVIYHAQAFIVNHTVKSPLIGFNSKGRDYKVNIGLDRVVIGFQNTVWWQLYSASSDWQMIELTDTGTSVVLLYNKKTHDRLVSVENVYGDEMIEVLTTLYNKGFRRFVYLGTAGGFGNQIHIGDVLIPTLYEKVSGGFTEFDNSAKKFSIQLPSPLKVIVQTRQGWVPSLIVETKSMMRAMQDRGVHALDIESRYFADFFNAQPYKLESSVLLTISDLPLGTVNYEKENATRAIPMESIKRLVNQLFN